MEEYDNKEELMDVTLELLSVSLFPLAVGIGYKSGTSLGQLVEDAPALAITLGVLGFMSNYATSNLRNIKPENLALATAAIATCYEIGKMAQQYISSF